MIMPGSDWMTAQWRKTFSGLTATIWSVIRCASRSQVNIQNPVLKPLETLSLNLILSFCCFQKNNGSISNKPKFWKKKKHPQLLLMKSFKVKNSAGCDKIRFDRQFRWKWCSNCSNFGRRFNIHKGLIGNSFWLKLCAHVCAKSHVHSHKWYSPEKKKKKKAQTCSSLEIPTLSALTNEKQMLNLVVCCHAGIWELEGEPTG